MSAAPMSALSAVPRPLPQLPLPPLPTPSTASPNARALSVAYSPSSAHSPAATELPSTVARPPFLRAAPAGIAAEHARTARPPCAIAAARA